MQDPSDAKNLHWTTNINAELPIKMRKQGPGSEQPTILPVVFRDTAKKQDTKEAMFIERKGRVLTWTWY